MKSGEVTLHIYPNFFTLIRKQTSRCIGRWKFEQLFNYGPVDGGFVFRVESESDDVSAEPDSFLLVTSLEQQINRTFDTVYKTAQHMYGSAGKYLFFYLLSLCYTVIIYSCHDIYTRLSPRKKSL